MVPTGTFKALILLNGKAIFGSSYDKSRGVPIKVLLSKSLLSEFPVRMPLVTLALCRGVMYRKRKREVDGFQYRNHICVRNCEPVMN